VHIGLTIVLGLHILLAGISTFFLARDHELGHGASLSAAFVFIFSATFLRRTMACHLITTVSWLPLIILLLRRAFVAEQFRSRILQSLAAGTAFGIAVLAGFPQMILYMALVIIGYGVAYRLLHAQGTGFAPRKRLPRLLVEDAVVGSILFVVGGLLAAAMLIPGAELASFSERGRLENVVIGQLHPIPWLFKLFTNYIGSGSHFSNYRLAGLGAFLLALAAFAHPRKRDVILFAALFYIILDCALGPPLPFSRLLLWSAPFSLKDHSRAILALGLPLAILVGFGVEAVAARWRSRDLRPALSVSVAIAGFLAFRSLVPAVENITIFPTSRSVFVFPGIVLALIVLAGLPFPRVSAAGSSRFIRRGRRASTVVALLLPLFLFGELVAWGHPYLGYLRERWGYKSAIAPLSERSTLWSDNFRQGDKRPNRSVMALKPAINGYDALYIERIHRVLQSAPVPVMSLKPSGVLAKNHRGNLFLKRSFWLSHRYADGPLPDAKSLFPSATTVFLRDAPEDLPVPRVTREEIVGRSTSEHSLRIPLAVEAGSSERIPANLAGSVRYTLGIPAFDTKPYHGALIVQYASDTSVTVRSNFRDTVSGTRTPGKTHHVQATGVGDGVLEFPLPDFRSLGASITVKHAVGSGAFRFKAAHLLFDLNDENARIRDLRRSFNSVEVELAELPEHRILTFVDAHYPGWHAYVDGSEVPIHLANDAFKAVVVPPGTHQVRFEFRPTSVYAGIAVSSTTLMILVAIFGIAGLRPSTGRRRRSADAGEASTPDLPGEGR
jgi:hypothetical protein